jgi:hypothetical protein
MKLSWKRIGVFAGILALVGVVGLASVAVAQGSDDGAVRPFDFGAKVHEAIASVLGIGLEQYESAVETARGQVIQEAVAEGTLTQEQADQILERMGEGFGPKGMPFGRRGGGQRMGGRMGAWPGGPEGSLLSVAAEQLDLEVSELQAELQDGKSIAEVAEANGVDPQAIADAFVATISDRLAEAVANERMTQEQADELLSGIEERVSDQLENSDGCQKFGGLMHGGRPGGFGADGARQFGGRGPGGMGRFGAFGDQSDL